MHSKINTMNFEALRRICWKLAKLYFFKSIQLSEAGRFKDAVAMADDSLEHLDRFRESQCKLCCGNKMFTDYDYIDKHPFKSKDKYASNKEVVEQQKFICEAHRDMNNANTIFQNAMEKSDSVDMDAVYDALDMYKSIMTKVHEQDVELEATAAANLGKIFYKGLAKTDKAKQYYRDSIRLLETLKPKTFND